MTLTLVVVRGTAVGDAPATLRLDQCGATIGRGDEANLRLPDDRNHISSQHLEIVYTAGDYFLIDRSTNGTVVDGVSLVPALPRRILSGELIRIGAYELLATLGDGGEDRQAAAEISPTISTESPEPDERAKQAGAMLLLRHMVRGVIRLVDARSRAKVGLGLSRTTIALDVNNPLYFSRSPGGVLDALLKPTASGFISATQAIDDVFLDFQAHEVALTAAAQAALTRCIGRFSPAAIRGLRRRHGWLGALFTPFKEAELWRAYEAEFEKVIDGSTSALANIFADEFHREYHEHVESSRRQRRSVRVE
jgi:predicted component of type VI protein secretion system